MSNTARRALAIRTRRVGISRALIVGVLLTACSVDPAAALGPGSVDRSFGQAGSVLTSLEGDDGQFSCCGLRVQRPVVARPNGGLLIGASVRADGSTAAAFAIEAYDAQGRLDPSFGDGGRVVLQLGSADTGSGIRAMVALPDGGVVAAGTAGDALAAARFDGAGKLVWSAVHRLDLKSAEQPPARWRVTQAIALQPDGDIVIAGGATATGDELGRVNVAVTRLEGETGALDTSFAGTGYAIEPPTGPPCRGSFTAANGIALDADGSITLAGANENCGGGVTAIPGAVLVRYTAQGQRVLRITPSSDDLFPLGINGVHAIAGTPDSKIVAAGLDYPRAAVTRLTTDGAVDTGFDRFVGTAPVEQVGPIVLDDAGRILTAIARRAAPGQVVRLRPDGGRDAGFDSTGLRSSAVRYPAGLALQPGGGVVVSGTTDTADGGDFALTRIYGGSARGRVALRPKARLDRGALVIGLRCLGGARAPGCEGRAAVLGATSSFALAQRQRGSVRVRLGQAARRRISRAGRVAVSVVNPPAAVVRRRVAIVTRER